MSALRALQVLLFPALVGLVSLAVAAGNNPSGVEAFTRYAGQSVHDFALKVAPPDELLLTEKVFPKELKVMAYELKLAPDEPKAIVAIYRQLYRKAPGDAAIHDLHHTRVYAYLPLQSTSFRRVLVRDFDLNFVTLGPDVASVFLINKVGAPGINLAIISSYGRMYNGVGGLYFDVDIYDASSTKVADGQLLRIDNLSDKLSGCDCRYDDSDTGETSFEYAKYKTASQVKAALRKMGYSK